MKYIIQYFRIGTGTGFSQHFAYDSFEEIEKKINGDIMKIIKDSGTKKLTLIIEKIK